MKEFSTSEVVSSRLLMLALSQQDEHTNTKLQEVMERGKVNLGKSNDKIYEVELRINGIEVDPSAYEKEIHRQMERMVLETAQQLVIEIMSDEVNVRVLDAVEKFREELRTISFDVRRAAAKHLGAVCWAEEEIED